MAISTHRKQVPEYDLPWWWQYGECGRHRPFATRKIARVRVRAHLYAVNELGYPCDKCSKRREPEAFRCPEGGQHFHWGHGEQK